jgi:hypothetical protein
MITIYKTIIAASIFLLVVGPVSAGYSDKHFRSEQDYCDNSSEYIVNQRLDSQWYRIEQGIDRDRLTDKEARILKRKHHKVRRLSREYQENGYLSRKEFRVLSRKLDSVSELIREYAHNDLERYVIYHDKYAQIKESR